MRILVTGGAGYIGSVLVKNLVMEGHEVRCLDLCASDLSALLKLTGEQRSRCELMVGDIRNPQDLKIAVDNIDAVIHLAAVVGSPACDVNPQDAMTINVDGTRVVAQTAPKNLPLICLSTCSVYGRVFDGMCRETDA